MPFPQGGDFPRSVTKSLKVVKADRRICVNENGTNVCNAGHKLKFPGTCLNQPTGTFNSTDGSFQPTFPVCTVDYASTGFNPGIVISYAEHEGSGTVFSRTNTLNRNHYLYGLNPIITRQHEVYGFSNTLEGDAIFAAFASTYSRSTFFQSVAGGATSFLRILQFNPGIIPHLPGVYSDLFIYDVTSFYKTYNRLFYNMHEVVSPGIKQEGIIVFDRNIVTTDYYTTIAGEVDICKGDEAPPVITYIDPIASGTVLRPQDQKIEFRLSDEPGGVDLSKLKITLTSATSGNLDLVIAGVDQTGGDVSIIGDSSSYLIRYTPDFTWLHNDKVVVTISGADLPPILAGNPFYCGAAGVNFFSGDITFKVLTPVNLGASVTAIGDVDPPYIVSVFPASGTVGNTVFTPVIIELADALTGIDLTTLSIVVDSKTIVFEGAATTSEVSIVGLPSSYTVTYNKEDAFDYGSTVEVSIYAEDRNRPVSNVFSTTYNFSCIEDSTLRIENFFPAIGTTVNPSTIDIDVDVFDDSFGVDESQSFLVINGEIVDAVVTPITSGIHFNYHPPNDFAFDRPIIVKVHGVNGNTTAPVVKEDIYRLYYGQRILLHNEGKKYPHDEIIDVFVHARNIERLHKDLSTGYLFTTYTQPRADIGAHLDAITPYTDLGCSITAQGPEHRYGQPVTVTFYVEDFEGHALSYTYTYTIEEEP